METRSVWRIIEEINATGQRLKKESIIRENRDNKLFVEVLKAAYNPFERYYMQRIPKRKSKGSLELDESTFKLLKALSSRRLGGKKARQLVSKYQNNMTFEAADLLKKIIKKDLRAGISIKTINAAIPGLLPQFDVMLAEPINWDRAFWPCYISPKIDGVRGLYTGVMRSRKGHKLLGLDHIIKDLKKVGVKMTDGEIVVPKHLFDDSSGLIRNHQPVPEAVYYVFDLPSFKVPFYARYSAIEGMFIFGEHVKFIPHHIVEDKAQAVSMYKEFRRQGYEGAVLKYYDTEYKRTRCHNWMKMVPEKIIDVTAVEVLEGKGKFTGMMGSVLGKDEEGIPVRISNKFSDKQRKLYFDNPDLIVGRVMETIIKERSKHGKLRSGRWNGRFRDDK
jgi:DNA ligase-1